MSDVDRLSENIAAAVKGYLRPALVDDVRVTPDFGYDGDPILQVRIHFDDSSGAPDVQKMAGLIGHLRSSLLQQGDDRFPIVSYLSKSDLLPELLDKRRA